MSSLADPYDVVRYPAAAFDTTHPSRLASIAALFGMSPAPVERCRVLELGANEGANLMPMAAALPGSTFVGIDRAALPVARGEAIRARLGLENLRLERADILDVELPAASFDYIIAHGVYAWVPAPVRDRLLAVIRRALAPSGVAYVSYNALPGCYPRRIVDDLMLYHTRNVDAGERAAHGRGILSLVAQHARPGAYADILNAQRDRLSKLTNEYMLHDGLAEHGSPVYLHEFVRHAAAHDLRYLGEANYSDMQDQMLPPEVRRMLQGADDIVAHDQYVDFFLGRAFRRTLLVHAEVELDRVIVGDRARSFFFTSGMITAENTEVHGPEPLRLQHEDGLVVRLTSPMAKAAIVSLLEAAPAAMSFEELATATRDHLGPGGELDERELGELLISLYAGAMLGFHQHRAAIATAPGPVPLVPAVRRLQASEGQPVIDAWHRPVKVDDEMRRALALVDGTRDRDALVQVLGENGATLLSRMAKMALLEK